MKTIVVVMTCLIKECSKFKGESSGSTADVQRATSVTCLRGSHVTQVTTNHLTAPGRKMLHRAAGAEL